MAQTQITVSPPSAPGSAINKTKASNGPTNTEKLMVRKRKKLILKIEVEKVK